MFGMCGECKFNERDCEDGAYVCRNVFSENYGSPTMYDDTCDDFEEKNESEE